MIFTPIPAFAIDYPEVAQNFTQLHLTFYCMNCYRKRPTTYLTPNFGPLCESCLKEIQPLLKVQV